MIIRIQTPWQKLKQRVHIPHYANQYERYESKNRFINSLESDYNNFPKSIPIIQRVPALRVFWDLEKTVLQRAES
jgi:hypothetical protein